MNNKKGVLPSKKSTFKKMKNKFLSALKVSQIEFWEFIIYLLVFPITSITGKTWKWIQAKKFIFQIKQNYLLNTHQDSNDKQAMPQPVRLQLHLALLLYFPWRDSVKEKKNPVTPILFLPHQDTRDGQRGYNSNSD